MTVLAKKWIDITSVVGVVDTDWFYTSRDVLDACIIMIMNPS